MKNKQVKRRTLALLLAVVLWISIAVPMVSATGTAEIAFGQVSGKCGAQVTVPVTIKGNPGIASFRFRIAYDVTALTYVSVTEGAIMTSGTLKAAYQAEDEELAITWFDVKNMTGDGVIFNLIFELADTANGQYPLTVSYLPEDVVNASWQTVDATVVGGQIQTGATITGKITSFGAVDDEVTIKLMQGEDEIACITTTEGVYSLPSIVPGTYNLVVSKAKHATTTYEITINHADVTQDVQLCLLGDVDGNGTVNVRDLGRLQQYLNGFNVTINLSAANVDGNKMINVRDLGRLQQYLNGFDITFK